MRRWRESSSELEPKPARIKAGRQSPLLPPRRVRPLRGFALLPSVFVVSGDWQVRRNCQSLPIIQIWSLLSSCSSLASHSMTAAVLIHPLGGLAVGSGMSLTANGMVTRLMMCPFVLCLFLFTSMPIPSMRPHMFSISKGTKYRLDQNCIVDGFSSINLCFT